MHGLHLTDSPFSHNISFQFVKPFPRLSPLHSKLTWTVYFGLTVRVTTRKMLWNYNSFSDKSIFLVALNGITTNLHKKTLRLINNIPIWSYSESYSRIRYNNQYWGICMFSSLLGGFNQCASCLADFLWDP